MSRAGTLKLVRQLLIISILIGCLCLILYQPHSSVLADPCTDSCDNDYYTCTNYCDNQANDCWNWGGWNCDTERWNCYNSCDDQHNSCVNACTGGGGGDGGGGTSTSDGHILCDGWDRQGDCVFNHFSGGCNVIFRRQVGTGSYSGQSFLSWFQADMDGFGRFPTQDGSVGIVCTEAGSLPGQVALHRWSTQRGFYYSIYNTNHGSGYVYGGVAAYVYPPGDPRGFPLYQFYSAKYGHYYTNYKNEVRCQPQEAGKANGGWVDQGEMARVNFPAPFSQATRNCSSSQPPLAPGVCDAFAGLRCQGRGGVFNFGNCTCSDGLP
jgi:hypothetical protein